MCFSSELWPWEQEWRPRFGSGEQELGGGAGVGVAGGGEQVATRKDMHFSCESQDETEAEETMVEFLRMKRENTSFAIKIHFPCILMLARVARKWATPDGSCS